MVPILKEFYMHVLKDLYSNNDYAFDDNIIDRGIKTIFRSITDQNDAEDLISTVSHFSYVLPDEIQKDYEWAKEMWESYGAYFPYYRNKYYESLEMFRFSTGLEFSIYRNNLDYCRELFYGCDTSYYAIDKKFVIINILNNIDYKLKEDKLYLDIKKYIKNPDRYHTLVDYLLRYISKWNNLKYVLPRYSKGIIYGYYNHAITNNNTVIGMNKVFDDYKIL